MPYTEADQKVDDDNEAWKEGDRRARTLARDTGMDVKAARKIVTKEAIMQQYAIAVEYEGLAKGCGPAFIRGWRKGIR